MQGSITGVAVYIETHQVSTNLNGLMTIEIGSGNIISGNFSTVNWLNGPYFIKTETDPTGGTNYTITGTSQLISVPYALHANTADSITGSINESDPVFGGSVAATITTTDINNWNNKLDAEVDGSVTNELQTISISGDTLLLSNGGFVVFPPELWDTMGNNISNNNSGNVGIGTNTPNSLLDVAGKTATDSIQVGNGNVIKNIQGGSVIIGQSGGNALTLTIVTFDAPFDNIPKVICTPLTEPGTIYDDSFNFTIRNITVNGFEIITNRVDGTTWGQNVHGSWLAFD